MTREEAREAIKEAYGNSEYTDEIIKALEQEPTTKNDLALIHTEGLDEEIRCTMCTNSMKSDRGCDGSCVVNEDMYKAVTDAIGKRIQPTTKNDLGVDCISRKAVLDITWQDPSYADPLNVLTEVRDKVRELPSVTPQEPLTVPIAEIKYDEDKLKELVSKCVLTVTPQEPGHWREDIDNNRRWDRVRFYCSECGDWQTYGKSHYCPNCGCRMVEPQESEDKE